MTSASFARRAALAVLLAQAGCTSRPAAPGAPASAPGVEALLIESQAFGTLFGPTHLLFIAAVVALALGFNALIQSGFKLAWRLGFNSDRSWARTSSVLRLIVAVLATFVILRGAARAAPVLAGVFLLTALLGFLFLSGFVPNVMAGVGLTLRRRIRVGDRVRIGEHEGVVRELGLAQLHLRGVDGATILLPNRLLNEEPVVVERARNSVPVRVRLELEQRAAPELLIRMRQVAALSPYRAPDSLVDVSRGADQARTVHVEIQVWAARAQREARVQLEAALTRVLAERGAEPPAGA